MRILLADDEKDIRSTLAEFIEGLGHQVSLAANGREALGILENDGAHLLLSDIRMPEVDGLELLRRIKQSSELRDIEVILFTGHGEVRQAVEAMREGAYDYLLKPINVRELALIIERIAEFLALREENRRLSQNFEHSVREATGEMRRELEELRRAFAREAGAAGMGVFSQALQGILKTCQRLHRNPDIPVLIEGETGTGKELVARYLHFGDGETSTAFVAVNCASISPNLFESELFGYEGGSFTGANPKGQKGKLELAEDGTIFLDEIGEMPLDQQAKLLRVIQEREFYRVGGLKKLSTKARVVCATNRDIRKCVADGTFRQDLYYRLNVGHMTIPPLRQRREEIIPLARLFMQELYQKKRTRFNGISPQAARLLEAYEWPGNVRELKSAVDRVALLFDDEEIRPAHLEFLMPGAGSVAEQPEAGQLQTSGDDILLPDDAFNLDNWTLNIVKKALAKNFWNKTETARYLGISRGALYTYLKHLNLE
jgi:two-component system, NtrC family, response regulator AtoC